MKKESPSNDLVLVVDDKGEPFAFAPPRLAEKLGLTVKEPESYELLR